MDGSIKKLFMLFGDMGVKSLAHSLLRNSTIDKLVVHSCGAGQHPCTWPGVADTSKASIRCVCAYMWVCLCVCQCVLQCVRVSLRAYVCVCVYILYTYKKSFI